MAVTGLKPGGAEGGDEGNDSVVQPVMNHDGAQRHAEVCTRRWTSLAHQEELHRQRHVQVGGVDQGAEQEAQRQRPQTAAAARQECKASIRNMASTRARCMPMARSVPISRVRSRMAIHRVFMMPHGDDHQEDADQARRRAR